MRKCERRRVYEFIIMMETLYILSRKSVHSLTLYDGGRSSILGGTALKCNSIIVWSPVKPHSNFTAITMTECYLILNFLNIYISKIFSKYFIIPTYHTLYVRRIFYISRKIFLGEIRSIKCKTLIKL